MMCSYVETQIPRSLSSYRPTPFFLLGMKESTTSVSFSRGKVKATSTLRSTTRLALLVTTVYGDDGVHHTNHTSHTPRPSFPRVDICAVGIATKCRGQMGRRWNHLAEIFPKTYRSVLASSWHPLSCRAIELGKAPQGGVMYTVVYVQYLLVMSTVSSRLESGSSTTAGVGVRLVLPSILSIISLVGIRVMV